MDSVGRKTGMLAAMILAALAALGQVLVQNYSALLVLQFLIGFGGAGGLSAGVSTYWGDMAPKKLRGRLMALTFVVAGFGPGLTALVAQLSVPTGPAGWHGVYLWGGVALVVAAWLLWKLPESPRWLASRGRLAEADRILTALESRIERRGLTLPEPEPYQIPKPEQRLPLATLLRGMYLRRLIVACIVGIGFWAFFYGFQIYLPTLLIREGHGILHSYVYTTISEFGGVFGGLCLWLVADRWSRHLQIAAMGIVGAILLIIFGTTGSNAVLLGSGFLIGVLLQLGTPLVFVYFSELFPTRARANGVGAVLFVVHWTPVALPLAIAWSLEAFRTPIAIFVGLAIVLLILQTGVVLAFGQRGTTQTSVEEINEAQEA